MKHVDYNLDLVNLYRQNMETKKQIQYILSEINKLKEKRYVEGDVEGDGKGNGVVDGDKDACVQRESKSASDISQESNRLS